MRSFASDNNSGVHPSVMEAIVNANVDHAVGYGSDEWTKQAEDKIKEIFGDKGDAFLVFNGTGANTVALQAVTRSFNSIICAETAHIYVDECGSPARMTGAAVIPIRTNDGKLTVEQIKERLINFGVCHHSQPKVVYISQVSELGTVYTHEEIRRIADLLHSHNMYLHMDGARLANACAYLNCSMRSITVDMGVDILSFGGTKNGMMMGEAVVSFRPEITEHLQYYRKQSAQLASKMRYLSAQFIPYLENNLWLENAMKANISAAKLYNILKQYPEIKFTQKPETNQLFFTAPSEVALKLREKYYFYFWNEAEYEIRLVTSWDTTGEDIAGFEQDLKSIFDDFSD
ncbi:low specificity L-threonine aldolase [Massilibacteroides sp.]|uniref:threonine aldolase family protein n=1 Tax=Massilibacteroides sp. TaxID=2034766 RepID=UPI0026136F36|nr:low specificity L-threonine aldolase [Massilibacteroides sp.]MDD4516391.1 low specificity L-threonine aldolase [Massilibacteroides sp.]